MSAKKQPAISQMINFVFLMGRAWIYYKLKRYKDVVRAFNRASKTPQYKRTVFAGYQLSPHDVFICTYAKSGTYWTMQIAQQIACYGDAEFEHIHDLIPWPDIPVPVGIPLDDPKPQQTAPTGLRIIKTHLESEYVPYDSQAKYVVVVRDPKDAFVSSYYFHKALSPFRGLELSLEEFMELFLENESPYDSWATHAASYWPWRARENVVYLSFEAMKRDTKSAVIQIARLMGVTLTEDQIQKVLDKSSFQYMKAIDHKFTPNIPMFVKDKNNPALIRSGKSGNSRELLTPEQQATVDRFCRDELRRLGSDLVYHW
jgi:hypothetical protein